ncbi:MAG: CoA ester lyase [Rhodospirillaceae bacterium]|jgi:(S)-citramalyl-CoA lyase|nr:CoA ester lyase [Rhodospirillaceae bacterium]MBT4589380.1 CoA ester lyase [Rhodospirillaceae bacterium]MBT5938923.1 CoA ester lyase [Rhodospirillaceae bacterium]MBT7267327.1 CoA ester lyase [Rhodospirillaceae bacterium]
MAMSQNTNPRRSLLFVPGGRLEIFPKALTSGTDIACIDLEDAVADEIKATVRADAIQLIAEHQSDSKVEIWLRVNSIRSATGMADILALAEAETAPDGIMLPKISSAEEVRILRDVLSAKHPDLKFHPLIETTEGLNAAFDIAKSSHKIGSLLLGGFDMSANLRVEPGWDSLLFARQQLVLAAANAKVDLLDMPHFGLSDMEGLRQESEAASAIGFTGKCAIHPKQIEIINQSFSPTAEEIAKALDLIAKYEAQDKAFVEIDGVLMEKPVVERLYRMVSISERIKN